MKKIMCLMFALGGVSSAHAWKSKFYNDVNQKMNVVVEYPSASLSTSANIKQNDIAARDNAWVDIGATYKNVTVTALYQGKYISVTVPVNSAHIPFKAYNINLDKNMIVDNFINDDIIFSYL